MADEPNAVLLFGCCPCGGIYNVTPISEKIRCNMCGQLKHHIYYTKDDFTIEEIETDNIIAIMVLWPFNM